jgi:beta-lactamase class C
MRLLNVGIIGAVALLGGCGDDTSVEGSGGAGDGATAPATSTGVTDAGSGGGEGGRSPADCSGTTTDDERFAAAMDTFRAAMDDHEVAGGAFAVIEDGAVAWVGVAGSKVEGACDPITPATLFNTGVLGSQLITAIAALSAVEDGDLELGAPITDAIPTLQVDNGDAGAITLHHLLSFGGMYANASEDNDDVDCSPLDDFFANAAGPVLEAPPGSMPDLNDILNLELAGLAVQNADGEPFRDVARRRVLDPLGMGGGYDRVAIEAADHAKGDAGATPIHSECGHREPSVGYHGSIGDVSTLVAYVAGADGAALDAETRDAIRAPQAPAFVSTCTNGYALQSCTPAGEPDERVHLYGGATWGFSQVMALYEERKLGVVILVNRHGLNLEAVTQAIARDIDPTTPPWWDLEYVQDPAEVASLAGTYVDDLGFQGVVERTLVVASDADAPAGLVAVLSSEGTSVDVEFAPDSGPDNFFLTIGAQTSYGRFWRDEDGEAYAVSTTGRSGPPFLRLAE